MTQNSGVENGAGDCCGGPPPEGVPACCILDAEAKAEGKAGCGCGPDRAVEPDKAQNADREKSETKASRGCCG